MEISFKTTRLEKQFSAEKELQRAYGKAVTVRIQTRMAVLKNAPTLADVPKEPPERCHPLKNNRRGEFTVDVGSRQRLVFVPNHDPMPRRQDGSVEPNLVRAITILGIIDPHDGKTKR